MKLKMKILVFGLLSVLVIGSVCSVIVEYSMSLNTKNVLAMLEREKKAELEKQQAIEAEKKYLEEKKIKAQNSYDKVEDYYFGLALVKKEDKYGYIDINGNEVIAVQYDMANNFTKKDYAKVKKDGKWGYINQEGKAIIPIEYSYCGEVSNDIVAVGNGGKYGFMSMDGSKVCDLIYDKVEAFDENGLAKVVQNGKYGYIDKNGKIKVEITTDYVEENFDFTGEWKQTDIHSSRAGTITITGQTATSFNFEIVSKYFSKSGMVQGTADIVKANVAEYVYNSGEVFDTVTFSIIDGNLIVSAQNGGSLDMDKEVSVVGTYTLDVPKYTNENVLDKVFKDDTTKFDRIKNALGEQIYEEYFLYGFKNGEYSKKEYKAVSDVIHGMLYTVTVPTMEKDFKLFISEDNIYFFAKHEEIYKTDDENRQSIAKMPAAVGFDEL